METFLCNGGALKCCVLTINPPVVCPAGIVIDGGTVAMDEALLPGKGRPPPPLITASPTTASVVTAYSSVTVPWLVPPLTTEAGNREILFTPDLGRTSNELSKRVPSTSHSSARRGLAGRCWCSATVFAGAGVGRTDYLRTRRGQQSVTPIQVRSSWPDGTRPTSRSRRACLRSSARLQRRTSVCRDPAPSAAFPDLHR